MVRNPDIKLRNIIFNDLYLYRKTTVQEKYEEKEKKIEQLEKTNEKLKLGKYLRLMLVELLSLKNVHNYQTRGLKGIEKLTDSQEV